MRLINTPRMLVWCLSGSESVSQLLYLTLGVDHVARERHTSGEVTQGEACSRRSAMARRAGNQADQEQKVTRRDILKTGVASGLGFSATTLTVLGRPTLSAAGGIYGGRAVLL